MKMDGGTESISQIYKSTSRRKLTRRTSFSCLSNTCVTKLRCVRNHCRAIMFPIPLSCSAIYPTWFPAASSITYLLACSKPLPNTSQFLPTKQICKCVTHIITFINSSCRCTTSPEFARIPVAGWDSLRTPWGSSGM